MRFVVDRGTAETEPKYKQIIPYAVVRHFDSCFVLERKRTQGERRLHDKLSLGVGGHINPTEGTEATDMVKAGLNREVHEELCIGSNYRERLIGLINDDTTEVGQVHLGVLFEIDNRSFDVTIRENEKMNGRWMRLDQLPQAYERLETWSQIVYDSYLCPETPNRPSTATTG